MTKKKAKKRRKKTEFDRKAPKGKIRIHQIMVIDANGAIGIWDCSPQDTLERAIAEACELGSVDKTRPRDVYHLDLTLPIPTERKPARVKASAVKKIAALPGEPTSENPAAGTVRFGAAAVSDVPDKGSYPIRDGWGNET